MNRLQDCFDDAAGDGGTYLFQGMRHDPALALIHFDHRHFSPAVQPWMPPDPVAFADGLNAYNALVDEPVNPIKPAAAPDFL